ELTYLYVRTAAQPETAKVTFPGGPPDPAAGGGFPLFYILKSEQITHFPTDFSAEGAQRLMSTRRTGPGVRPHNLTLTCYPAVGGTAASPIPFEDVENFIFTDSRGSTIGSVKAPVLEGRAILSQVEGIPPQMASQIFGGFGRIEEGTGQFAGASGIVTNVGIGTADPHLTDILYMFEFADPTGK